MLLSWALSISGWVNYASERCVWHNLSVAYIGSPAWLPTCRCRGTKRNETKRNCKRYQIIFNYVRLVRVSGVARSNASDKATSPVIWPINSRRPNTTKYPNPNPNPNPNPKKAANINSITNGCACHKMGQACDIINCQLMMTGKEAGVYMEECN